MDRKLCVFIGSSLEGLPVAEALQSNLEAAADVELWTQGIFELSMSFLDSLISELDKVDFAILILSPDDIIESRGEKKSSPRDNVIFELGLFMGKLGKHRCFFVFEHGNGTKIPSDLLGIAAATYRLHGNGNISASLGPVATKIKNSMSKIGFRPMYSGRSEAFIAHEMKINPDLNGKWLGYYRDDDGNMQQKSVMHIRQNGSFIYAQVERQTNNGFRRFEYEGRCSSGQIVLFFEDKGGRGFVIGTIVLRISSDVNILSGKSTYYHHDTNTVLCTDRFYKRVYD